MHVSPRDTTVDAFATARANALPARSGDPAGATRQEIATGIEFELVTQRSAFDALEADWTALYEADAPAGQPFQGFAFCWHWANNFLDETGGKPGRTTLSVLTGRRDGRLVLVWPMVRVTHNGLASLRFLGDPVCEYGDVLLASSEPALPLLRAAWTRLARHARVDFIALPNVREDAVIAPFLAEIGAIVTKQDKAPYMDLSRAKDFAAYAERYSRRTRSNRRRKRDRLAAEGSFREEMVHDGPVCRARAVEIIGLKRKWLQHKGIMSRALSDPRTTTFFADLAEGKDGKYAGCRIFSMHIDDKLVAAELTLVNKSRLVNHVLVYDIDHDRNSPGQLLTEDSLARCFTDGIERYDLMGPADAYKMDWADGVVAVDDYAVPTSLLGRAFVSIYLGFGRERLKKIVRNLPEGVRRHLASYGATLLPMI
ncbi:MAG: GNAT family N-acetyltransferase [Hyphomicrobiaceae bacterium]|nr:GNAT family N-acetyltransferase [Hyphomicrobiaceae bacterium]